MSQEDKTISRVTRKPKSQKQLDNFEKARQIRLQRIKEKKIQKLLEDEEVIKMLDSMRRDVNNKSSISYLPEDQHEPIPKIEDAKPKGFESDASKRRFKDLRFSDFKKKKMKKPKSENNKSSSSYLPAENLIIGKPEQCSDDAKSKRFESDTGKAFSIRDRLSLEVEQHDYESSEDSRSNDLKSKLLENYDSSHDSIPKPSIMNALESNTQVAPHLRNIPKLNYKEIETPKRIEQPKPIPAKPVYMNVSSRNILERFSNNGSYATPIKVTR